MQRLPALPALLLGLTLAAMPFVDAAAQTPSRGELLYSTHCIACHATQMHWREKRLATDWPSLSAQVRRFQGVAKLGWNDDDILEVTRYLNDTIYRFPSPGEPRG